MHKGPPPTLSFITVLGSADKGMIVGTQVVAVNALAGASDGVSVVVRALGNRIWGGRRGLEGQGVIPMQLGPL